MEYVYSLFIWPFQGLLETLYVVCAVVLKSNPGSIIALVSMVIHLLLLPFYKSFIAMELREKSPAVPHPHNGKGKLQSFLAALKPFTFIILYLCLFIAGSDFFINLSYPKTPFLFIRDLSRPDHMLVLGNYVLNWLPLLMLGLALLVFLLVPLVFYRTKKIIPGFMILLLFFIILFCTLYNAPPGLLLFWITGILFLFFANVLFRNKNSGTVVKIIILVCCVFFIIISVRLRKRTLPLYTAIQVAAALALMLITVSMRPLKRLLEHKRIAAAGKELGAIFKYACIILFLLTGIAVPLLLASSSPGELEHAGGMIARTALQAASIFLILLPLYRIFAGRLPRRCLALFMAFFVILSFICCFVLPKNYGTINIRFVFENRQTPNQRADLVKSAAALAVSFLALAAFIFFRKARWLKDVFLVLCVSLVVISGLNLYTLAAETRRAGLRQGQAAEEASSKKDPRVFHFSKSGDNVFILFLDRASGYAMPYALELEPGMRESLDGFVWYPNTLSFSDSTLFGLPAMMGGYEYRPLQINERPEEPLREKVNEALRLLPAVFGEAGYTVTVTDPSYGNLDMVPDPRVYDGMENVSSRNISGIFSGRMENNDAGLKGYSNDFDFDIMMRFSLYRILPPTLSSVLYNNSKWLKTNVSSNYGQILKHYPNLLYLDELCKADAAGKNLNIMMNESVHAQGPFNRKLELSSGPLEYTDEEIARYGSRANTEYIYTFTASLAAVCRWFGWLKQEGMYNNTRIILVSDHGRSFEGKAIRNTEAEACNPLLLVKDFRSAGPLAESPDFMTNADLPLLAAKNFGRLVNPYTGRELNASPKNERLFVCFGPRDPRKQKENGIIIDRTTELINRNIFDKDNWKSVK